MAHHTADDNVPLLGDSKDEEILDSSGADSNGTPASQLPRTPAQYLAVCCTAALLIYTITVTIISTRTAFVSYAAVRTPKQWPDIYAGLAAVTWSTPRCLERTIYPDSYAVALDISPSHPQRIHAPRDEIMFEFGGHDVAHLTFYVGDSGLENCTLAFNIVLPSSPYAHPKIPTAERQHHDAVDHEPHGIVRQGYMDSTTSLRIPSTGATLRVEGDSGKLIAQIPITQENDTSRTVSAPFWCPNSQHMHLSIACPGDCRIRFGLQGMTSTTSSSLSGSKTGFFLTQYEDLACIPSPRPL